MHFASRFPSAAIVCLAASAFTGASAMAQAPGAPATLDVQLLQKGEQFSAEGKHADAAVVYEDLIKKYPQSPVIPEATFRAAYAHYLSGNYDAALADFKKVLENKGSPPELAELALSLTPQVLAAKAAKLASNDPARKVALEDAVKQFDVYLTKFPNSDEAESATFSKALALYQLGNYDAAATALRGNMQKFAQSPTMQDSQYLLALTLGTIANVSMQKATGPDKAAEANYDDAEKLLRDIITKRLNLSLVNDAQFQVGELLLARGGFLGDPNDKEKQAAMFAKAIEAYRSVQTKDLVIQSQKARVAQFIEARNQAGIKQDRALFQKLKRLVDKEQEKLALIEGRTDQTVTAKMKTGQIYFQLGKMDEARVLFSFLDQMGLVEDPEEKKHLLYFITMTYAAQAVVDKAVEKYNAFQAAYKADPIAENLQLLMGAMYLSPDKPKQHNPETAIQYFKEGVALYPKGKFLGALVLQQALAMIQLQKFDDALRVLKETLDKNPPKELAVDAEFFLATVYAQTGKTEDAVKTFKGVREKYPGTPQAEQSSFQVGQLLLGLDPKAAVGDLQGFITKFPKSAFLPSAMFALGSAQAGTGQKDAALTTFKDLATKFPKSEPAPFSYFERAKILAAEQKFDECVKVMRDFGAQYPDSPALFQAYDFVAQIQTSQSKGLEAIATYEEFVEKRPKDPACADALLKLSSLWKGYADAQGPYLAMGSDEAKRGEWRKGVDKGTTAAERVLTDFPESQAVALALNNLLDTQRLQQSVKLKTEAEIEQYFQDLAKKFADKPGTQAKILFTLAAFTFEKDKAKAVEQMTTAYKPDLKFAAEDLDLYGLALIENKKYDEAIKVYEKLNKDYPAPASGTASREVGEAQAIVLAGLGKALQEKGDKDGGAKKFAELEKLYAWSPKMLEVNYGIALDLHDKKQDEEAVKRLLEVIKAQKATAELRAKSMLLVGKIHEANRRFEAAIDNYIKISAYYSGVPKVAAEGLWLGGQLLERQASGEIPMPTPTPKPKVAPSTPKPGAGPAKK